MTMYRLHVALVDIKPVIWRRIELSSQTTLKQFHLILQIAMGWENCHLHAFEVASLRFGVPDREDGADDPTISENGIRVAQVLLSKDSTLRYSYDFGDGWNHDITLEAIVAPLPEIVYPRVIEGARSCPPEDCGGPPGYADLLRVLKSPKNKEYARMRELVGLRLNPEAFSLEDTNLSLRRNRSLTAKV